MLKLCKITAFFKPGSSNPLAKDIKNSADSKKRVFSEEDFVTIPLKHQRTSFDGKKPIMQAKATEGRVKKLPPTKKSCPFFKKIPETSFAVDAFSFGLIDGIKFYFLTHFHSDHYMGLRKSFTGTIVCSPITGRLVSRQMGINMNQMKIIECEVPTVVDGVQVLFYDANHCPGAVIILFTLKNGKRVLHTGDFRASKEMENQILKHVPIADLYLDTTYCDPKYCFPPQCETLEYILCKAKEHLKREPKTLIVSGTYSVGKEKVFIVLGSKLNLNVWVSAAKRRLLDCYQDEQLNRLLTRSEKDAQIHVLSMREITLAYLNDYLENRGSQFKAILAFKPTGWEFKRRPLNEIKPYVRKNVTIYGVPYSEHSSFDEMKHFIASVKPSKVIPTVNMGNPKKREEIQTLIKSWMDT